jgi:hypothetical protein
MICHATAIQIGYARHPIAEEIRIHNNKAAGEAKPNIVD